MKSRAQIALAKAIITVALDAYGKDRADDGFRKAARQDRGRRLPLCGTTAIFVNCNAEAGGEAGNFSHDIEQVWLAAGNLRCG